MAIFRGALYSSDLFVKYAKEHGKRVSEQAYAELEAANTTREHNELERRVVMRNPLTELDAQQRELAERMRGPLAGYEAQQRELAERMRGPLAGYDTQQQELAKALKNLSNVDKADISALQENTKRFVSDDSGSDDLRVAREPDDNPKKDVD